METLLLGIAIVVGVPLAIWLCIAIVFAWPIWVPIGIVAIGISIGSVGGGIVVAIGLAIGFVILLAALHISGVIN